MMMRKKHEKQPFYLQDAGRGGISLSKVQPSDCEDDMLAAKPSFTLFYVPSSLRAHNGLSSALAEGLRRFLFLHLLGAASCLSSTSDA
mmetsp:Transcript_12421/g.33047  ORF Transcript_12421/g.33047 Transcript_12421/m.33047 type:complete len:88 (-) Transcript_12421:188-451(-)